MLSGGCAPKETLLPARTIMCIRSDTTGGFMMNQLDIENMHASLLLIVRVGVSVE